MIAEAKIDKRHEKSADTKDKLLRAAEALFVERGYDAVSVSDIARAAGATKGHLYYYFKNKEELFDEVLKRHLDAQREAVFGAASVAGGDIRERIHGVLDSYIDFIERNPGFPRLIQREMCSRSESVAMISDAMSPVHQWGSALLAQALPGEGPAAARHFFFSIYSMTLNYYTYAGMLERLWGVDPMSEAARAERREHLRFMTDMIIDNLLPENRKKGDLQR